MILAQTRATPATREGNGPKEKRGHVEKAVFSQERRECASVRGNAACTEDSWARQSSTSVPPRWLLSGWAPQLVMWRVVTCYEAASLSVENQAGCIILVLTLRIARTNRRS